MTALQSRLAAIESPPPRIPRAARSVLLAVEVRLTPGAARGERGTHITGAWHSQHAALAHFSIPAGVWRAVSLRPDPHLLKRRRSLLSNFPIWPLSTLAGRCRPLQCLPPPLRCLAPTNPRLPSAPRGPRQPRPYARLPVQRYLQLAPAGSPSRRAVVGALRARQYPLCGHCPLRAECGAIWHLSRFRVRHLEDEMDTAVLVVQGAARFEAFGPARGGMQLSADQWQLCAAQLDPLISRLRSLIGPLCGLRSRALSVPVGPGRPGGPNSLPANSCPLCRRVGSLPPRWTGTLLFQVR